MAKKFFGIVFVVLMIVSVGACSEGSPSAPAPPTMDPECSDGVDNDGDGKTDYPADLGCSSPQDDDEGDEPTENSVADLSGHYVLGDDRSHVPVNSGDTLPMGQVIRATVIGGCAKSDGCTALVYQRQSNGQWRPFESSHKIVFGNFGAEVGFGVTSMPHGVCQVTTTLNRAELSRNGSSPDASPGRSSDHLVHKDQPFTIHWDATGRKPEC